MTASRRLLASLVIALVGASGLLAASPATAQLGLVIINGVQISPLDAYLLGIPDGNYWYDPASGYYGYVGGPAIGNIVGQAGEPGYNHTTIGGGQLMSDGQCAFVTGVPVGNC